VAAAAVAVGDSRAEPSRFDPARFSCRSAPIAAISRCAYWVRGGPRSHGRQSAGHGVRWCPDPKIPLHKLPSQLDRLGGLGYRNATHTGSTMAWFKKESATVGKDSKLRMPEGLWVKCEDCKEILSKPELEQNLNVCPHCQRHFRVGARTRVDLLVDPGSFTEYDASLRSLDPLEFKDQKSYADRLKTSRKNTGMEEALLSGTAAVGGFPVSLAVMEFDFMGGSMGSAVGEKITRAIERAVEARVAFIAVTCSGGARMQESVLSLMQMAKTSAALGRLAKARLPYISILTDPTTGGVTASYAMLGDILIAEPKALIGFAGPRVIQDTIRQELPAGFQRAEFLLDHGFVDMIVERKNLRPVLCQLLGLLLDSTLEAVPR
jgi:acetyl-CoA carboxylase carboxyl transferase subunit beta